MACYFAARETGSNLLLALAYSGCMLNLFNLIPILPLDGGRITSVISPKVWLVGVPLLAGLFFVQPSPMLILIGILALPHLKTALSDSASTQAGYYAVASETRINYAVMYLGLAAFLAMISYSIHRMLGH
jgi:Zn-dependent protease